MSTFQNTPSRKLPPNPSLKSLKNQAKQLLKAHRAGDFDACYRFQNALPRFSSLPEAVIQAEKISLADAQVAIAREYGFPSWPKMKAYIGSLTVADAGESQFQRIVDAIASGETETLKTLLESNPALKQQIREVCRVKSRFLASVSREFSAPLTVIKGGVDDLLLGDISEHLSERQLDNLKKVQQTADHLTGLLNEIEELEKTGQSQFQAAVTALISGDTETLKALLARNRNVKREVQKAFAGKPVHLTAISHELRTPMKAIIGFTRLILRREGDQLPDRQKGILDRTLENAEALLGLINDQLDLSEIDLGMMDVNAEWFHVKGLIVSCASAVHAYALERDVEIGLAWGSDETTPFSSLSKLYFETQTGEESMFEEDASDEEQPYAPREKVSILRRHFVDRVPVSNLCDEYGIDEGTFQRWQRAFFEHMAKHETPDPIGEAYIDGRRLQQVIFNLLSNAVKFAEQGQVVVRASKDATSGREESLVISISDTGTGIPADAMDTLFEAFSIVKVGGPPPAGMDLPITKGIVELLGGSINVESEVGKGSTFTVRVPAAYREA